MAWWINWSYVIQCEGLHYLLGFSVGLLTSSLILIIYLTGCMALKRPCTSIFSGRRWAEVVFYILCFSVSASLASHVLEDYWFSFF